MKCRIRAASPGHGGLCYWQTTEPGHSPRHVSDLPTHGEILAVSQQTVWSSLIDPLSLRLKGPLDICLTSCLKKASQFYCPHLTQDSCPHTTMFSWKAWLHPACVTAGRVMQWLASMKYTTFCVFLQNKCLNNATVSLCSALYVWRWVQTHRQSKVCKLKCIFS